MRGLIILSFLILSVNAYADRVILLDKDGKHLMTSPYSDTAIEAMRKDAQSSGLDLDEVVIKRITESEWLAIKEEQIDRPAKEKAKQKEQARKQKETAIKTKLNLTNADFADLKEALGVND